MDAKRIIVDFLKWDCEVNYGTSVGYEAGISKKADEYLLRQTHASGETNDTGSMDPIQEENNIVKKQFNLDEVLDFTKTYNVQIVQGADLQYHAYIGKKFYGTSMTPMHALWYGIQSYKKLNKPSSGDNNPTGNIYTPTQLIAQN